MVSDSPKTLREVCFFGATPSRLWGRTEGTRTPQQVCGESVLSMAMSPFLQDSR